MARVQLILVAAAAHLLMLAGSASAQGGNQDEGTAFILMLLLIAAAIYLIPTFVAFSRGHPNRWVILIINVVFGGTGLGWLGSLVWACSAVHRGSTGNHGGESGLNLFANDPVKIQVEAGGYFPSTAHDPGDELVRLKQLFDAGAIDEAEYHRLRAGPINRLAGR